MKKIIYLFAIVLLGTACSNKEIMIYDLGDDGIQFEEGTKFKVDFDFAFQYTQVMDEWGYPERSYFGDALRDTTFEVVVSLMGWPSEQDRNFKLKAIEGEGLSTDLVALEDEYTFRAGMLRDTIRLVINRPAQRGKYKTQLTFATDGQNSDFVLGAEEKLVYTFNITDQYPKPRDWDERVEWLGEYSEEKYAFIVTTVHKTYDMWIDWGMYNEELREALDQYNAANPDSPKDFTFPVNTTSIWDY